MLLCAKTLTASLALAVGGVLLVPSAAPAATDPAAPTALAGTDGPSHQERAAAWLVAELEEDDGILVYYDRPLEADLRDVELSMEAAEALEAIGGHGATVQLVVDAVVEELSGRSGEVLVPSERASYLAFLGTRVPDPRAVAGRDLVAEMEEVVAADGRLQDDPGRYGAATVPGQALAVRALRAGGSPEYVAARDYLVRQQCPRGPFGPLLAAPGRGPACSAASGLGTIAAGLALAPELTQHAATDAAVVKAATWLRGWQRPDGVVERVVEPVDGVFERHTGPAVRLWSAVRARRPQPGLPTAIRKARVWVNGLQQVAVGSCRTAGPTTSGAVDWEQDTDWQVRADMTRENRFLHGTVLALPALTPSRPLPRMRR